MGVELREVNFHVTDTTKPLAAAMAIEKLGNRIVAEDGPGRRYVENLRKGTGCCSARAAVRSFSTLTVQRLRHSEGRNDLGEAAGVSCKTGGGQRLLG